MSGAKKARSDARPRRDMPGGAEAIRAQRQARAAGTLGAAGQVAPATATALHGRGIIASAWTGTAIFLVATAVASLVPAARIPAVVVDLGLLAGGSALYLWGWAIAAGRSREDEISLWNLILLQDVAPANVRARLLGALGLQVVVAAATCWITAALAFGWLVPVWGLAHCELWGARHGVFPARPAKPGPARDGMGRSGQR